MSKLHAARASRWFVLVWLVPVVLLVCLDAVLIARAWRAAPEMQSFLADYPGQYELPEWSPIGFPAWLGWQHFLNGFFLLMIVRTGWRVHRMKRPSAFFSSDKWPFKTRRVSLDLWVHLAVDILWVANGILFVILLFATGQWVRVVPTSWEVLPNAFSAALQYVSLEWPTENGWTNYNSLQQLSYAAIIFVASPLAIVSGARMSLWWPKDEPALDRLMTFDQAKRIHLPVMFFFVAFTAVHVFLVLATGALRNLNHMYAAQDDEQNPLGLILFLVSVVVMVVGWWAVRPAGMRWAAKKFGTVK